MEQRAEQGGGRALAAETAAREAASDLAHASKLASDNPDVEEMLALVAEAKGDLDKAVEHVHNSLDKTPDNPRRLYLLALAVEPDGLAVRRASVGDTVRLGARASLRGGPVRAWQAGFY